MNTKISVIIPIFNVCNFIERCVVTLFEQTLKEVEYIFVNDATPDHSIQLLEEVLTRYPERKELVRIVHHSINKGLPAARNTGLNLATGEYIFHCDSDDYVEPTMLEELYNAAKKTNADIVWCDWFLTFAKNERYMSQPSYNTPMEALKAMLSGAMKYNVWNKLVRRSLYNDNNICFPTGYGMGEDMTMMILFANASKVSYVPQAFYHYVKLNSGAFSQTYSERHLSELKYNVWRITSYMEGKFGTILEEEIAFFKLDVKYPFLISDDKSKYRLWKEWYSEANKYIGRNKLISKRSIILQWVAARGWWWLVRLYYVLVNKMIYGIVYR